MSLVIPQQSPRSYQQSSRYSPYPVPNRSYYQPTQHTYHNGIPYNNFQHSIEFQSYPGSAQGTWPRASYAAQYPITPVHYDENSASSYSREPPMYMLPHTDPMSNGNAYFFNQPINRNQQNGLWSEPLVSAPPSSTQFVTSSYTVASDETLPSFQPSTGVTTANMLPTDRTLPTPSASRGLAAAPISSVESLPMSRLSYKSPNSWQTDAMLNTTQAPNTRYNSSQDSNNGTSALCPTQDMPFGYIHEPQETVLAAPMEADTEILQSPHETRMLGSIVTLGNEHHRRRSHESSESSPSNVSYGHTSGSSGSRRSTGHSSSTGHLVSGQEYVRLPNIRNDSIINDSRTDCAGYQANTAN
jgi:hypothetical protein